MVKGKTPSGFEFEANEKMMKSARFLRMFRDVQRDDNGLVIFDILELILGKEQADALIDFITDDEGFDSIDRLSEEFVEIFNVLTEAAETKN